MLKFMWRVGSLGIVLAAAPSACGGLAPNATPKYADGMTAGQYRAAYEVASARCDRQTDTCSSFATRDRCIEAKLDTSAADMRLRGCSNHVDEAQVRSCAAEIRSGVCGSGITQIKACKHAALCPYVSEEGTL